MTDQLKQLPPVRVPEPFYELIRLYAFRNKLSVSGAVRQLVKESPSFAALAQTEGLDLEEMAVHEWGGARITREDSAQKNNEGE
jgi:hypothetical protein